VTPGSERTVLRFEATSAAASRPEARTIVVDTTWTPRPDDDRRPLREIADRVLQIHDPIVETSQLLDGWAGATRIADLTTVDGTSFWFYGRLRHWMWLQSRLIWLWILDTAIADEQPTSVVCGAGVDRDLVDMAARVCAARGLAFADEGAGAPTTPAPDPHTVPAAGAAPAAGAVRSGAGPSRSFAARVTRRIARRLRPTADDDAKRAILDRLGRLEREPGRLLVVLQHAPQRVERDGRARMMNVYLDPIADRLRGTRLDPIAVHITASSDAPAVDPDGWADRVLPGAVLRAVATPTDGRDEVAAAIAELVAALTTPVVVAGVDLGPALAAQVAAHLRQSLPWQLRAVPRIRRLLRRLRPAGILLADEYHRQEWLGAAALEGVPVVAVQHGLIYRWHNGYMFPERPAGLRLPDRLYVFGPWERRLLIEQSVFEPERVRVGGSPRLDLTARDRRVDPAPIRAELGVAPGDRMVVISGSWGSMYRRFQLPISLARIVDRALPGVHLVVKLHPGEPDEGPYRAVIEGVAAAAGRSAPPISLVRDIDLYRLLAAADAHIGFHSTVLTEAAVTGTRNLLADVVAATDLLGWLDAGVAFPIRDGGELLAALDDPATVPTEELRRRFLDEHFASGDASERIAGELLSWLPDPGATAA